MSGDESDIAYANANDDFERINHIPVFRAFERESVTEARITIPMAALLAKLHSHGLTGN